MTFHNSTQNSMTFQAWKAKKQNSMTFPGSVRTLREYSEEMNKGTNK